MLKKSIIQLITLLVLTISLNSQASIPEDMTDAEYQAIVTQVVSEQGYFDAVAVEDAIGDWLLNQGVPNVDGDLLDSGSCNPCSADGQSPSSASPSDKASGPVFHQPRNIKVKAKKNPDGTFKSVVKVKWKRPKKLDASLDYVLDHYLVYISKNNQSYEIFKKKAKFKRNGKPKKKQSLKFKNRGTADYSVQVQAVYVPTDERPSSTDKSVNTLSSSNKSSSHGSTWPPATNFTVIKEPTQVMHLTGAIKTCLNDNGHPDSKNLLHIQKDLYCIGYNLQDSDISQMSLLQRVMAIDISNNPSVTNIGPLSELNYLFFLNISQNPNIVNSDYSIFEEVRYLRMQNMGLNALPDLSSNDNLKYLDVRSNQISSGFIRLPATLDTLLLDENGVQTCAQIIADQNGNGGTNDIDIYNLSVSADNNSIEQCLEVRGLRNLKITEGNFASNEQTVTGYPDLYSLSVTGTNLKKLHGTAPYYSLILRNNSKLKKVNAFSARDNNLGIIHYPGTLIVSDDQENLLCSNKYAMLNARPPSGPLTPRAGDNMITLPEPITELPQNCSPDKVNDLKVYSNEESSTHFIKWSDHQSADLWGVTHYKIFGSLNNQPISSDTIYRASATDYVLTKESNQVDQYRVVACTLNKCGYEASVNQGQFIDGLGTVTDTEVNFNGNELNMSFRYIATTTEESAKPTYFHITSDMSSSFVEEIQCGDVCGAGPFTSNSIAFTTLGTYLNVQACNGTLGCGAKVSVNIIPSITDNNLPVPQWNINGQTNVLSTGITLSWRIPQDHRLATQVDYYEITEWKPKGIENGNYPQEHNVTPPRVDLSAIRRNDSRFYVERGDTFDHSITLTRIVNGYYDYDIRACKRNRNSEDQCSEYAGGVYEVVITDTSNPIDLSRNCHTVHSHNDSCLNGNDETYDFKINNLPGIIPQKSKITPVEWFIDSQTGGYHISWDYDYTDVIERNRVDYFFITQQPTEAQNNCDFGDPHTLKMKVNFADMDTRSGKWSSLNYCADMGEGTAWNIQACKSGHGCSLAQPADLGTNIQFNDASTLNQPHPSATLGSNILPSSNGGPGDFLPGMWWNQELAGSGWHFYWASDLRLPSSHPHHGNTYDLVGYWFAYKQDKDRGVWTPTWFEARLKAIDIAQGSIYRGCFEGDILHNNGGNNNPLTQVNVGNVQVCFKGSDENPDNTHATLLFDINQANDILSQESDAANLGPYENIGHGRLKLEIRDFSIGIVGSEGPVSEPNNADHYSGLWQNNIDSTAHTDVSLLTWIEKGMEVSTLAIYDEENQPIWFQGVNCGPNVPGATPRVLCNATGEGYFDEFKSGNAPVGDDHSQTLVSLAYGFNPIGARPDNFGFQNVIQNGGAFYYGKMGRCLNDGIDTASNKRFRNGGVWYDISHDMYTDEASIDAGIDPREIASSGSHGNNCATTAVQLTKTASLHDINFELNDYADQQANVCNPNVDENPGYCHVTFKWYTDDDFSSIKPYYSIDGGTNYHLFGHNGFCTQPVGGDYVVDDFFCDLTNNPGTYRFQLRKDNYNNNQPAIIIAESDDLEIVACNSEQCQSGTVGLPAPAPNPTDFTMDSLTTDLASDLVGSTSGSFDIDESGSANYSIPIYAPAGRGGLAPQMGLNYNSNASNGIAGIGWNISGISSISRCLKSAEHDPDLNYFPALQMDESDALCMDGQRLFKMADGTYRTEMDSFNRITPIGEAGNGPSYFKVETKSGEIRYYGSPHTDFIADTIFTGGTGAQIISNADNDNNGSADGTVYSWLLSSIEDRHSNAIHFQWDTKDGESYLSHIKWANMDSSTGNNHYQIDFEYSTQRDDATHHYGVGTQYKAYRNLTGVSTFIRHNPNDAHMQQVRYLKLNYETTANPTGMLRMASVEQCLNKNANTCLQPVAFDWGATQLGFTGGTTPSTNIGKFKEMGFGSYKPIDINGDGQMELIFIRGYDDGNFLIEDLEAQYWVAYHVEPDENGNLNAPIDGEYDGGGLTLDPICEPVTNGYYNFICNTLLTPFDADGNFSHLFNSDKWFVLDYNGDGYQDILTPHHDFPGSNNNDNWFVYLSDGTKICTSGCAAGYEPVDTQIIYHSVQAGSALLDYTADGLPDLLTFDEQVVNNRTLYKYKLFPMIRDTADNAPNTYRFAKNGDAQVKGFIDMDTDKLIPRDMMCEYDDLTAPIPCFTRLSEGDIPPIVIAGRLETTATDFNGDGYNDAIYRYTYRYVDESCNIPGDGNPPNNANLVAMPLGEYTAELMSVNNGGATENGSGAERCEQRFRVAMLFDKDTNGNISFKYAGRLGMIDPGYELNDHKLPVISCNEGNSEAACTGEINRGIGSSRIIDVNGDGLADHMYLTADNDFKYQLNTGVTAVVDLPAVDDLIGDQDLDADSYDGLQLTVAKSVGLDPIPVGDPNDPNEDFCKTTDFDDKDKDACARRLLTQFIDYDLDGDTDILYSGVSTAQGNLIRFKLKKYQKLSDGNFGYVDYQLLNAEQVTSYDKRYQPQSYINTMFDINGDGHNDYFSLVRDIDTSDGGLNAKEQVVSLGSGVGQSRNKIKTITNFMNDKSTEIEINYMVATNPEVYTKNTDAYQMTEQAFANNQPIGNGSPIIDVFTPTYLVQSTVKKVPEYDPTIMQYTYEGFKVQGGGRGSLGFKSVSSHDTEHSITTITHYRQDFPFTGMPQSTESFYVDVNEVIDPNDDEYHMLSSSESGYAKYTRVLDNGHKTHFPYLRNSVEKEFSLDAEMVGDNIVYTFNTLPVKTTVSNFRYDLNDQQADHQESDVGNLITSEVKICTGNASLTGCNAVEVQSTVNAYDYDNEASWLLGRLSQTAVTTTRSGDTKVRTSSFQYDTTTGQLIEEMIHGDASEQLRTVHQYDDYGQKTGTYQCSSHFTDANACTSTAVKGRPTTQNYVHRYNKTVYDTWDNFAHKNTEPFSHYDNTYEVLTDTGGSIFSNLQEGSVVEDNTTEVLSRDVYGNPTKVEDMYGNQSVTAYGVFGEAQISATSLGSKTTTIKRWCDDLTGNQANLCDDLKAVSFVLFTTEAIGGSSRKFFDVMGREVRSQTLDFEGKWTTVDTFYDALGRTTAQSEPYSRSGSNNAVNTSPDYRTYTQYDALDRVMKIISPNHCVETFGGSVDSCTIESVITTTKYDGLVTSTTNANDQTTTQVFDASGKIIKSIDANGSIEVDDESTVHYQYDGHGNLSKTTSHLNGVAIDISMQYDNLGRKIAMQDPDKGNWTYAYNALGEMTSQSHSIYTEKSYYDVRGRMFYRESVNINDDIDEVSLWEYDVLDKGLMTHEYSVSGHNPTNSATIAVAKDFHYDVYKRPSEVVTTIYDGESFNDDASSAHVYRTSTTYDEYGRVFQSFDASGNGVLFEYNQRGFQYRTRDAADGTNGQIYHEVLNTDQRGNVISEKHMDNYFTNKTYLANTGYLQSIKTNSSFGSIQDLSFAFDRIGNLIRRTDYKASNDVNSDNITETFFYDDLNRMTNVQVDYDPATQKIYRYDETGNLIEKDGMTLNYPNLANNGGVRPHGVISTDTGKSYEYDNVGNVIKRKHNGVEEATFAYTSFDKPHTITANDWTTEFAYDASRSRYIRKDTSLGGEQSVTHYLGSVEYTYEIGKPVKARRYVGNLVINIQNDSPFRETWDFDCLLKDHIGSTHTIVNQLGEVTAKMSFGAWGQRRVAPTFSDVNNYLLIPVNEVWSNTGLGIRQEIEDSTNRGFTGHEHLDQVGIIHMNGRIYDPTIGRFLQADPIIQDPYDTQSLNRYSYVMNNPLSFVDPSGYSRLRSGWWKVPLAIGITALTSGAATGQLLAGTKFGTWASTNAFGVVAVGGALSGAVATGNLKGALKGAVTAVVTYGIGHGFDGKGGIQDPFAKGFAHSVVSGVSAEVDGGNFGHGFVSSALSQSIGGAKIFDHKQVGLAAIVTNAILQGSISELMGGKFANGAITGAFRVAFNDSLNDWDARFNPSVKENIPEPKLFSGDFEEGGVSAFDRGLSSVYRDYFRVLWHYESLAGEHGVESYLYALSADVAVTSAMASFVNDEQLVINNQTIEVRDEVMKTLSNSILNSNFHQNVSYMAGRTSISLMQSQILKFFGSPFLKGRLPVGASTFSIAGFGTALGLYDKGITAPARLITGAITGQ